jgi:hypothetical protein
MVARDGIAKPAGAGFASAASPQDAAQGCVAQPPTRRFGRIAWPTEQR